jgi:ankyrin repeat protein
MDVFGRTPLHYAAFKGDVEMVQLLLQRGAQLNLKVLNICFCTIVFFSSLYRSFSGYRMKKDSHLSTKQSGQQNLIVSKH